MSWYILICSYKYTYKVCQKKGNQSKYLETGLKFRKTLRYLFPHLKGDFFFSIKSIVNIVRDGLKGDEI